MLPTAGVNAPTARKLDIPVSFCANGLENTVLSTKCNRDVQYPISVAGGIKSMRRAARIEAPVEGGEGDGADAEGFVDVRGESSP